MSAVQPPRERKFLPYHGAWPFVVGVTLGLVLRLVFSGRWGDAYGTMMVSFLFLAPLAIGVLTVYVAERRKRRSIGYYIGAPVIANVLFVAGTILINLEGFICALLIVPVFSIVGAVGGLIMGGISRWTHWPKQTMYAFVALPLLLGAFEQRLPVHDRVAVVERTMEIGAPAAEVWRQIHHADAIRASEVDSAWMYRIGVPTPQAGVTTRTAHGLVRKITMGKGIHFDQRITDWEPNRHVRFEYDFAPDSFPPRALDDHVKIGGHYFDLVDTSYELEPRGDDTQLTIRMRYRVSTQFNWYAEPLARWLVGDFEETILGFYKRRSEGRAATVAPYSRVSSSSLHAINQNAAPHIAPNSGTITVIAVKKE